MKKKQLGDSNLNFGFFLFCENHYEASGFFLRVDETSVNLAIFGNNCILLLQTWHLYERRELVGLVDTALNGDFDAEEACRFLKIGLLCTQDTPKLRPSMSTVVKMLKGLKEVDDTKITKPGLISDFMDLKIRSQPNSKKTSAKTTTSSYNESSGSDNPDNSNRSSQTSAAATSTFISNFSFETTAPGTTTFSTERL